jgi:hypothetical protein
MTPLDVLSTIRQAGGRVVVLDGDLQVIAPPGTVSAEMAAVLREFKAALIGILPDAEREAVRWVEDLAPEAAEAVVETARREMEEIVRSTQEPEPVVVTIPEPVVEPDLDQQAEPVEFTTPEGLTIRFADPEDEEEIVVPPPPCQQCGGFMFWWDFAGRHHCMVCERTPQVVGNKQTGKMVTIDSARVRKQAARLRRQVGAVFVPT